MVKLDKEIMRNEKEMRNNEKLLFDGFDKKLTFRTKQSYLAKRHEKLSQTMVSFLAFHFVLGYLSVHLIK